MDRRCKTASMQGVWTHLQSPPWRWLDNTRWWTRHELEEGTLHPTSNHLTISLILYCMKTKNIFIAFPQSVHQKQLISAMNSTDTLALTQSIPTMCSCGGLSEGASIRACHVLRLQKIQAICSRDLSQSFEIEFGWDKRVPLMPKVLS